MLTSSVVTTGMEIRKDMYELKSFIAVPYIYPLQTSATSPYSGGNKRKLSTAIALIGNPSIIFLVCMCQQIHASPCHTLYSWPLRMSPHLVWTLQLATTYGMCSLALFKKGEVLCWHHTGVYSFAFTFKILYVCCLHTYTVWRSVRLCAPGWPSWWMENSSAWEAFNTWRASELWNTCISNCTSINFMKDVGMAVPKPTETRCRDGSVHVRHDIQSNPIPTSFFYTWYDSLGYAIRLLRIAVWSKKRCRDGVTCVVFVLRAHSHPYTYIVSVVFGTAIPTLIPVCILFSAQYSVYCSCKLLSESIKQIITITATRQKQSLSGRSLTTITLELGGWAPPKFPELKWLPHCM